MVELTTPIRLYWDLAPDQPAGEEMAQLCADVAAVRFLTVHLRDEGRTLSPGLRQAVEMLAEPGRALLLSAALDAVAHLAAPPAGIRQLVLAATTPAEVSQVALLRQRFAPLAVAVSFPVPTVPLAQLPDLLAAAVAAGLTGIHFPMQRLTAGEPCWLPAASELATLAQAVRAAPLPAAVQLTIHDPFIWRAFHPDVPFPDGGCQAANTMLYLSPAGMVYPCPLVPVALGSVKEHTLVDIAAGAGKRQVRAQIRRLPTACDECAEPAGCHGGCRGRALVMSDWQASDPACGR